MNYSRRPWLTLIMIAIAIGGTGLGLAVWLADTLHQTAEDWQLSGLIKLGSPPTPTPAFVEMVAQYDLVAFSYGAWDTPAMQQAAVEIRKRNLDIHLGTYVHLFTAPQWCKIAAERGKEGWHADWWRAVSPYLARTAGGDTAAVYMNNYCFNVTIPAARTAAIGQVRAYVEATGVTWAMLDFASVPLESFMVEGYPERDPDFDGNGIACKDDQVEKQLLKDSWYAYARELREALGSDFLLIPNGTLAMYDTQFSKLVDGAYIEGFPIWFYGSGTTPNYTNALNQSYGPQALPNLCAPDRWARSPGYVLIEDRDDRGSYGALAALWPGCVEMRRSHDDVVYPPLPIDLLYLGAPLAPAYPGWGRLFEHGTVSVVPAGGRLIHSIERTEP
jgi:hypothetical protein